MMANFTLNHVALSWKAPHGTVSVDTSQFPVSTLQALFEYGVRQQGDAYSGALAAAKANLLPDVNGKPAAKEAVDKAWAALTEDARTAAVSKESEVLWAKRLATLKSGDYATGVRNSDPLATEVRALLAKAIPEWGKLDATTRTGKVEKVIAGGGNEGAKALLAEAKKRVASAAKLKSAAVEV